MNAAFQKKKTTTGSLLSGVTDAFKAKIFQKMSTMKAKQQDVSITQNQEVVISEGTSRATTGNYPDKIIVDLDTQQEVIVDMVDPDFYERKRQQQTSPLASSNLSLSPKDQKPDDATPNNLQEFFDGPTSMQGV